MAQTIRVTITPEIEKALHILRQATIGTLNTTELIKMAVGREAARQKEVRQLATDSPYTEITPEQWDLVGARQFYNWAKEDGSLEIDNISPDAELQPFVPEPYVPDR